MPIPGTLVPVPWQPDVAQVQLRMFDHDGTRFFGDPRALLERELERLCARSDLTPVVAIEYEFYLVDRELGAGRLAAAAAGPLTGRREFRTQINSMTDLNEYSPCWPRSTACAGCRTCRPPPRSPNTGLASTK